jgi:hypothetical protein
MAMTRDDLLSICRDEVAVTRGMAKRLAIALIGVLDRCDEDATRDEGNGSWLQTKTEKRVIAAGIKEVSLYADRR